MARGRREKRPIRLAGWAFPLWRQNREQRIGRRQPFGGLGRLTLLTVLLWFAASLLAQQDGHAQTSGGEEAATAHDHHRGSVDQAGWEGSPQGIAYSEFNHHLAGLFVLVIGLIELSQALAVPFWLWARFLLPGAFFSAGLFLLVWSDHEGWPVGSLSFAQTFFGGDSEIVQHKTYALLSLTVGAVELWRRVRRAAHPAWATPLPLFAIIGGIMLFWHSHGVHPAAHKITIHHAVMGTLAMTAGSSKLMSSWKGQGDLQSRSYWEIVWAGLILVIGVQLLFYSE